MKRLAAVFLIGLMFAAEGAMAGTGWQADFDAWEPISAHLNQKMATRTGPGTKYTEDHGTVPMDTVITLFQQEMGSGVPWGMVEFRTRSGALVRAYTGMKRIEADETPPWAPSEPEYAVIHKKTRAYFGPGPQYMPAKKDLTAGASVEVWGDEQGYALIEYRYTGSQYIRVWVPVTSLSGYVPTNY